MVAIADALIFGVIPLVIAVEFGWPMGVLVLAAGLGLGHILSRNDKR